MKNVECNAKEMVVALVAKTIFKSKNGVRTRKKVRQTCDKLATTLIACRKN